MIKINTYAQYFTVTAINFSKLIFKLHDFNNNLKTNKLVMEKQSKWGKGRLVPKVDKYYYIIETENSENPYSRNIIRYPINILDKILKYFTFNGINQDEIEIIEHKPFTGRKIKIAANSILTPRPYQAEYINKIKTWSKNNTLVDLQAGMGKFLNVNTPIKTKYSWSKIGILKVGDLVIGNDGRETKVTGVYPQGIQSLYNVTFEDGRTVEAGLEHLWTVYINGIKHVTDTKEMIKGLEVGIEYKTDLMTPIVNDNKISEEELKLYINRIQKGIIDRIPEKILESTYHNRLYFFNKLFIKNKSLINNKDAIVSGLPLAISVQKLIRSIGGICKFNYYGTVDDIILEYEFPKDKKLKLTSIKYSKDAEAVCISVDNKDKLYVAKDYIVTHNTFISVKSIVHYKEAFSIIVLPRYIDKWINDIIFLTNLDREDICVIQGITNLNKIVNDKHEIKKYKVFIISLTTLSLFIKAYLNNKLEYDAKVVPENLFNTLGTSIVLNDESHQEFHNVFKVMLFSNVRLLIGLTATLLTNDKDMERMHNILFPEDNRISNVIPYNKYINVYSVRYRLQNRKFIRFKSGFGYSQPTFEASIMRNRKTLLNYYEMIKTLIKGMYIKRKKKGDKMLIFMGTVEMCKIFVNLVKKDYSNLIVGKYTEEDSYDVFEESDIIISTIPSAGTAIDIADLIAVIQTVNVDSPSANTQTSGRLREIKGREVLFAYIWCADILPHKKYNYNRINLFNRIAKSVKTINYNKQI